MIDSIRARVGELIETLSQLDGLLEAKDAGRLPGMALARTAIAVDAAAAKLGKLLDQLDAGGAEPSAKTARVPKGG